MTGILSHFHSLPQSQEPAYTITHRPPELICKDADLSLLLDQRCDAWAAGYTIIDSAGITFFYAETELKIVSKIKSFESESLSGISGSQVKRLKEALHQLDQSIRAPVSLLTRANSKTRATVGYALSKVRNQ